MAASGLSGKIQAFYNCTIANNYAIAEGGGVRRPTGTLRFYSTIIAGNMSATAQKDIYAAAVAVCSNSIVGDRTGCPSSVAAGTPNAQGSYVGTSSAPVDPRLMSPADNGGPTKTLAFRVGSPALNHGSNVAGLSTDQRGTPFARTWSASADIGAFEYGPFPTSGAFFKMY